MFELRSAEIQVNGPKDSVITEYRAADCHKSQLVQVNEPPSGDGELKKGSVTQTMDVHLLNSTTHSVLCNWPLFCAVKA